MTEQVVPDETKPRQSKRDFFEQLALSHLPEMRLLFRGGKLYKKDQWRNIVEHSLVQVAVADELSDLIGLSPEEKDDLIKVAACHDWRKRLERYPDDFTKKDETQVRTFLKRVGPKQNLMYATGPDFLKRFLKGESSFLERLQCYIDDIVLDSDVIGYDRRLEETRKRYPELDDDFFEKERGLDNQVAQEIFMRLPFSVQGQIGEPKHIPNFIRLRIEKRWLDNKQEELSLG